MKLYLLRHGDAVDSSDSGRKGDERPLTPKGVQRTKSLAHVMRRMEISFDAILSSPLTRAWQTAEIVARNLGLEDKLKPSDSLTPAGNMEKLVLEVDSLRPNPKAVLLVGHEPYLSTFISLICLGGPGMPLTLKKGALCRLEVGRLICARCAELEWLLQPRLLGFKPPRRKAAGWPKTTLCHRHLTRPPPGGHK
jgi:phosphohistidine phosphatase